MFPAIASYVALVLFMVAVVVIAVGITWQSITRQVHSPKMDRNDTLRSGNS
ncbi:MAG: hypothetical protein ABEJ58_04900 [Halodesulfurarchaeum sp.]